MTKDVPADALAVGRARLAVKAGRSLAEERVRSLGKNEPDNGAKPGKRKPEDADAA